MGLYALIDPSFTEVLDYSKHFICFHWNFSCFGFVASFVHSCSNLIRTLEGFALVDSFLTRFCGRTAINHLRS